MIDFPWVCPAIQHRMAHNNILIFCLDSNALRTFNTHSAQMLMTLLSFCTRLSRRSPCLITEWNCPVLLSCL